LDGTRGIKEFDDRDKIKSTNTWVVLEASKSLDYQDEMLFKVLMKTMVNKNFM
jgi:hypothetical protein